MRGPSPFSAAEREIVFYYVSTLNRCAFCTDSHTVALSKFEVPEAVLNSVREEGRAEGKMDVVLRYVRKLTLEPHSVSQADVDAMVAARWDETAIVHAAHVCAIAGFYNRVVEGLGITSDRDLITACRFLKIWPPPFLKIWPPEERSQAWRDEGVAVVRGAPSRDGRCGTGASP